MHRDASLPQRLPKKQRFMVSSPERDDLRSYRLRQTNLGRTLIKRTLSLKNISKRFLKAKSTRNCDLLILSEMIDICFRVYNSFAPVHDITQFELRRGGSIEQSMMDSYVRCAWDLQYWHSAWNNWFTLGLRVF